MSFDVDGDGEDSDSTVTIRDDGVKVIKPLFRDYTIFIEMKGNENHCTIEYNDGRVKKGYSVLSAFNDHMDEYILIGLVLKSKFQ